MPYDNRYLEILVGNIESRVLGPAPNQLLTRLNPVNPRAFYGDEIQTPHTALVYNPSRQVFLTGALKKVRRILGEEGIRFRLRDHRVRQRRSSDWKLQRHITLRWYQEEAVRLALREGKGILDMGTGAGKTVVNCALTAALGLRTLYLVTTRVLMKQTMDRLREFLGCEPGQIGEGVRNQKDLTVALVQALDPERDELDRFSGGAVFFDEGHHACALVWSELIRRLSPAAFYCSTSVPYRVHDQVVLDALAGPRLMDGRFSARFLLEKGFVCPVFVQVEHCKMHGTMTELPFDTLYRDYIIYNRDRNRRIVGIAKEEVAKGRSVVVLVDHVRHGKQLVEMFGDGTAFVCGRTPKKHLHETIASFTDRSIRLLIATSGLFMEGTDISGIQVLIQGGAMKSRTKVVQSIGRCVRPARGKKNAVYVDFFDDDPARLFSRHSIARLSHLKSEGFMVPPIGEAAAREEEVEEIPPTWHHVVDTTRFYRVDGEGRILEQAECVDKSLVPEKICRRCKEKEKCGKGEVEWPEDTE